MNDNMEVQVSAPIIRVALHGEEDCELNWVDLDEHDEHNPATISDNDLVQLTANFMDMTEDELTVAVYGREDGGKLRVSRAETGNVTIRPETVLGSPALPTAFAIFVVAMSTPAIIIAITKLRQLACRDNFQDAELDIYEGELSSRGESQPHVSMVFDSNEGGAPSGISE